MYPKIVWVSSDAGPVQHRSVGWLSGEEGKRAPSWLLHSSWLLSTSPLLPGAHCIPSNVRRILLTVYRHHLSLHCRIKHLQHAPGKRDERFSRSPKMLIPEDVSRICRDYFTAGHASSSRISTSRILTPKNNLKQTGSARSKTQKFRNYQKFRN